MSNVVSRKTNAKIKNIYIWKILEGGVPNCGIKETENIRKGRLCMIPPLKMCSARVKTLRENSFKIVGPKLFNCVLYKIRNKTKCSIDDFKIVLDKFLSKIPDEPKLPGYTLTATNQFSRQPSNCLIDQIRKFNQTIPGGG